MYVSERPLVIVGGVAPDEPNAAPIDLLQFTLRVTGQNLIASDPDSCILIATTIPAASASKRSVCAS